MGEMRFDAERLQDLMDRRGVSDYQVAEAAGISRTMVYYLRKGQRKSASAEVMTKLAKALETTVDYFIGADDSTNGRVTVTVPEGVRRLTEVANRLSELRQEELVRIAEVLEKFEREEAERNAEEDARQIAEIEAAVNVYERKHGTTAADDLIAILAANFPELRPFIRSLRPAKEGRQNKA